MFGVGNAQVCIDVCVYVYVYMYYQLCTYTYIIESDKMSRPRTTGCARQKIQRCAQKSHIYLKKSHIYLKKSHIYLKKSHIYGDAQVYIYGYICI